MGGGAVQEAIPGEWDAGYRADEAGRQRGSQKALKFFFKVLK